ncbi:MAG: Rrf2 family transcriptional regulator [Eudoraea sp.]|nr:Rrf2 family transcriptional regulator [Eudoraea sp.]NNJ41446.1 Rrf2 family transcriptional regulator [Eudoraea sp.]
MLSNSSKYALKAVIYLTLHTDDTRKMTVKEISSHIQVPQAYVAKLLQDLSKRDLISSTRGPKGGFYVNETNKSLPISSIVYAVEGRKQFSSCLLGLEDCDEEKPCPVHHRIVSSRSRFLEVLEKTSIAQLAGDLKAKKAFLQ